MPTGLMAAVALRLRQITAIGKAEYVERHVRAAKRFRTGLTSMGVGYLVPDAKGHQVTPSSYLPAKTLPKSSPPYVSATASSLRVV
jgi:aspartate aminotransferase-like enzyme